MAANTSSRSTSAEKKVFHFLLMSSLLVLTTSRSCWVFRNLPWKVFFRFLWWTDNLTREIVQNIYFAHPRQLRLSSALCSSFYRIIEDFRYFKLNAFRGAKFMYCYHHQILPPLFSNLFVLNNQVHNYYTRSAGDYRSQTCQTNKKIHSSLSRAFFMGFFAYQHYEFRNPILF